MSCPSKAVVQKHLAYVFMQPGLYSEALNNYEKVMGQLFMPVQPEDLDFESHLVDILEASSFTFTTADAICILIHNQIPLSWVDHAYTYRVTYLDYIFFSDHQLQHEAAKVDNERLQYLNHYGMPLSIPGWDRWHEATIRDQQHLLLQQQSNHWAFDDTF